MKENTVEYDEFTNVPLNNDQKKLIKENQISIKKAKELLQRDDVDVNIFVKLKEENLNDANKFIFGDNRIIADLDPEEKIDPVQFLGTVLHKERTICDPVEILNNIEPYVEFIFI